MTPTNEEIRAAITLLDDMSDIELEYWRRTVRDIVRRCAADSAPTPAPDESPGPLQPEQRSFAAFLWVVWQAPDLVGRSWRDRRPLA